MARDSSPAGFSRRIVRSSVSMRPSLFMRFRIRERVSGMVPRRLASCPLEISSMTESSLPCSVDRYRRYAARRAGTSFRERFSICCVNCRSLMESTASMFKAREGFAVISPRKAFLGKKKSRESRMASALAGNRRQEKTGTSQKGSPAPKTWRICSLPDGDNLKIFTMPSATR